MQKLAHVHNNRLRLLGFSDSLVKVIHFFALHPEAKVRFRDLMRHLSVGSASVRRDLDRLTTLGALKREKDRATTYYSAEPYSAIWGALLSLVRELSSPEVLVREAVRNVEGVAAAFIYGSVANNTAGPDSDIDLFVVSDNLDRHTFYTNVAQLQQVTGKEVNTIRYSKDDLAKRLAGKTRFVRDVLQGEKVWVAGDQSEIRPIAIAAGLSESSTQL